MLNVNASASSVEAIINYIFRDKLLCAEAVQMASPHTAVFHNGIRGVDNNKRLSILGDAVLSKVACAAWFQARDSSGTYSNLSIVVDCADDVRQGAFSPPMERTSQRVAK